MGSGYGSFICPRCDAHGFGKYCSSCGASLSIAPQQFTNLLVKRLTDIGYDRLTINSGNGASGIVPNDSSPTWLPSKFIDDISQSISGTKLPVVDFLAIDMTNVGFFMFVGILNDSVDDLELSKFAKKTLQAFAISKKLMEKNFQIRGINLAFFVVSEGGVARERIRALRSQFPTWPIGATFYGVSLEPGDCYPKNFFRIDSDIRRVMQPLLAQLNIESALKNRQGNSVWKSLAREAAYRPTEELRKFWALFSRAVLKPMVSAREIAEGRLTLSKTLSYLGLLTIFTSYVVKALRISEASELFDFFPILGEITVFLLTLVALAAASGLLHGFFRLAGGKGSFEKTFTTNIVLMIIFLPIGMLLAVLSKYFSLSSSTLTRLAVMGLTYYGIPMFSTVHNVSYARVIGAMGLSCGLLLMVFLCVHTFLGG